MANYIDLKMEFRSKTTTFIYTT